LLILAGDSMIIESMRNLKENIALVTGASKGIGAEIAKTLAGEGATVILASRTIERLQEVCTQIKQSGGSCVVMPVDMSDENSIRELVKTISDDFGKIDILVNNAGVTCSALLKDTSTEDWEKCLRINATGPFVLCRESLRLIEKSQRGFIINVGSVVSIKGYPKQSAYTASKHALRGMTKSLAEELNGSHISVHMICPGGVDTEMVSNVRPDINKEEMIEPREIAEIVKFIVTRQGKGLVDEFRIRRAASSPWF